MMKHNDKTIRALQANVCFLLILLGHSNGFSILGPKVKGTAGQRCFRAAECDGELCDQEGTQISRSSFFRFSVAALFSAAALPATVDACATRADELIGETFSSSSCNLASRGGVEADKTIEETISGFVAGASVSASKTLVKYPLDTATVRLQMPETHYTVNNLARLFDGSFRGVTAPLVSNIPAGAVFFAVKDASKAALRDSGLPKWVTTSLAVAVAQVPYWIVRNPSEVVKTRQQAAVPGYGQNVSTWDAFRLVRDEAKENPGETSGGFEALYTGYWENILYAFPADVIKFVCYERVTRGRSDLPPQEGALAGALSTAVAQFLTTPLDVVRNRIMAGEDDSSSKGKLETSSYFGRLVALSRAEGGKGLFAGSSPRVGKAILSGAIQFATYEETKQSMANFFK